MKLSWLDLIAYAWWSWVVERRWQRAERLMAKHKELDPELYFSAKAADDKIAAAAKRLGWTKEAP